MWSSSVRVVRCPMTHTLLVSTRGASPAGGGRFRAISALIGPRFLCCDFADLVRRPIASVVQTVGARQIARLLSFRVNDVGKWRKSLASCTQRSKHPTEPSRLKEIWSEWNARNWQTEAWINYRSDTLHRRPGRKLTGNRLGPQGRSGRRRAASLNQGNWFAAIAAATTWLLVS